MNCKTCEYPLWNLATRQCPECGAPFKPSDFEFALNAVRFCCLQCRQPYYGTGGKGHLVPLAFACVRCGASCDMDSMILLPTEGVKESQTKADEMPWLVRAKTGRLKAWFATMGRAMADPGRLIELVPENRSASEAIWYAVITNMVFLTTSLCVFFLPGMFLPMLRGASTGVRIAFTVVGAGALLILLPLVVVLLWGALSHLVLHVTGGTKQPIARTFHAIGYSAGTNVLLGIPCVFFLAPIVIIWWVITAGIMLHRVHSLRAWRSVTAVAVPPLLLITASAGLIFLTVSSSRSARLARARAVVAGGATNSTVSTNLGTLAGALAASQPRTPADWPEHGLLLLTEPNVLPAHFFAPGSSNSQLTADLAIETIALLDSSQLRAVGKHAAALLPPRVIAHRVGDMVFTYHGFNPGGADAADFWVLVEAPEDAAENSPVRVVRTDGVPYMVTAPSWTQAVEEQNALRISLDLPPIPDPRRVTYREPAVAP